MHPADPTAQRRVLAALLRACRGLRIRLQQQSRHLSAGDYGDLNTDSSAIEAGLVRVAEILRQLQQQVGCNGVTELDGRLQRSEIARPWRRLVRLMHTCDQQNQQNGVLLQQRQIQVQTALNAVIKRGDASLYGRAGRQHPAPVSSRLLGLG
ncbi:MAG: hypothetical protein CMN28_16605 [Salinisphaeraceae bacterium]|jgi:flagellar biosynthesis/type III secretory pathway chaperone|nr:hypothetical protein [Salinisphaeraceae bacterium]